MFDNSAKKSKRKDRQKRGFSLLKMVNNHNNCLLIFYTFLFLPFLQFNENPYTEENQKWWVATFKSCLEGGFDELKKIVGILQKNGLIKGYEPPKELTEKIANIDKEAKANVEIGKFIGYIKDDKGYGERPDSPVDWEGVKTHDKIHNALIESYKSEGARTKSSDNVA